MNIEQILGLNDKDAIPSFKGSVKSAYNKETKNRFTWQNLVVEDETGEIKLALVGKKNQIDNYRDLPGQEITVTNAKFDGSNTSYLKIRCDDSAKIVFGGQQQSSSGPAKSENPRPSTASSAGQNVYGLKVLVIDDEGSIDFAKVWIHTYEAMKPEFEKAGLLAMLPERVTARLMCEKYHEKYILKEAAPPSWRDAVVSTKTGKKLGEYTDFKKLMSICFQILEKPTNKLTDSAIAAIEESCKEGWPSVLIFYVQSQEWGKGIKSAAVEDYIKENRNGEELTEKQVVLNALVSKDTFKEALLKQEDEVEDLDMVVIDD